MNRNGQSQDDNDWSELAVSSFAEDWDNEKDALYDNWRKIFITMPEVNMDRAGRIVHFKEGAYGVGRSKLLKEILREKIRRGYKIITVIGIDPDKGNEIPGKGLKD